MADPTIPVPRAGASNTLVEAALPRPGQTTLARVLAQSDATLLRLMTPGGTITLPQGGGTAAFPPGTQVRVSVTLDPSGAPRVTVAPVAAEPQATVARPGSAAPAIPGSAPSLPPPAARPAAPEAAVRVERGASATTPAPVEPAAPAARDLLQALAPRSVAGQTALPRALAPIVAAAEAPAGSLPEPVRAAAGRVQALLLPLDRPPTPAAIAEAVARSGVLRETTLARADRPPADLKSTLLDLVRAIGALAPRPPAEDLPRERPPVPRRGQTPAASAPERVGAAPAADMALPALKEAAEGALDRVRLLQIASSADGPEAPLATTPGTTSLSAEVPVRLGDQIGVMAFAIDAEDERRGAGEGPEAHRRVWRLTFAIDLEPLGPVHGQVRLQDGDAAITLWAERADTARAFLDAAPELRRDLAAADLAVVDVAVKRGQPPQRPEARAGRALDLQA